MTDNEYEILPHQLLSDLKDDVEALKKKLTKPDSKMNELILEIESMKDSIHDLNTIFQKALEDTKDEDVYKSVQSMQNRMDDVVAQNETIAKGMVAISDKLEDFMHKNQTPPSIHPQMNVPVQHTIGVPNMGGARTAPPPKMESEMGLPPSPGNFPPPPPRKESKRSLGGIFNR
jgi:hypothetical protein